MNKRTSKWLSIFLIIIIFSQILYLNFDNSGYNNAKQKAETILNKENVNNSQENITELTKSIRKKELKSLIKNRKTRLFINSISADEKQLLIKGLTQKLSSKNPEEENKEILKEIKVIKEGYNIMNYTTEKIFKLTSIKQLEYYKNYFVIIVSFVLLLLSIVLNLITKKKIIRKPYQ